MTYRRKIMKVILCTISALVFCVTVSFASNGSAYLTQEQIDRQILSVRDAENAIKAEKENQSDKKADKTSLQPQKQKTLKRTQAQNHDTKNLQQRPNEPIVKETKSIVSSENTVKAAPKTPVKPAKTEKPASSKKEEKSDSSSGLPWYAYVAIILLLLFGLRSPKRKQKTYSYTEVPKPIEPIHTESDDIETITPEDLGRCTELFVFDWLKKNFPNSRIYKDLYLDNPLYTRENCGYAKRFNIDSALLCRHGIIVFEVKANRASETTLKDGGMEHRYTNQNGEVTSYDFDALKQNGDHLWKLKQIINKKIKENVPLKGIVTDFQFKNSSVDNGGMDIFSDNCYIYLHASYHNSIITPDRSSVDALRLSINEFQNREGTITQSAYDQLQVLLNKFSKAQDDIKEEHAEEVRLISQKHHKREWVKQK